MKATTFATMMLKGSTRTPTSKAPPPGNTIHFAIFRSWLSPERSKGIMEAAETTAEKEKATAM